MFFENFGSCKIYVELLRSRNLVFFSGYVRLAVLIFIGCCLEVSISQKAKGLNFPIRSFIYFINDVFSSLTWYWISLKQLKKFREKEYNFSLKEILIGLIILPVFSLIMSAAMHSWLTVGILSPFTYTIGSWRLCYLQRNANGNAHKLLIVR